MRKIIIPSILLTSALAVGSIGIRVADAQTSYPPIVQKLAERFSLKEDEVQDVFDEAHDERHAAMMATWEERLNDFVSDGKLTQEQKQAIVEKHNELEEKMLELRSKDPEERKDQMLQLHEEFRQWLQDNNIDPELVGPYARGFKRGFKAGMMLNH